jgi:hypothetical protein
VDYAVCNGARRLGENAGTNYSPKQSVNAKSPTHDEYIALGSSCGRHRR